MLFNSYHFIWFLPLALAAYWALRRRVAWQNAWLVVCSYVFYAWWDVRFLLLIAGMTLVGFCAGRVMEHAAARRAVRRAACIAAVTTCVGVLAAFKYYDFFASELNALLSALGLGTSVLPLWHVILPVGISFYTFQVLSYAIDVYKGRLPACRNLVSFAAFVSFFPQLVAGPIERATSLLVQMQQPRTLSYHDAVEGARLMLWGFVKKMLLADACAPVVNTVFSNPAATGADLWCATILFAFQIYGDFSGYSDIALGTARLFGIRLTQNFRLPYFATSVPDFWRRWHITLMTWFKDYVYIPLGGSRCSSGRWWRNLAIVFLLSGLWHGANWTFVAWGLFQLLGYLPLLCKTKAAQRSATVVSTGILPRPKEALQMLATFLFVCIGWVFFRSESIGAALQHLVTMFSDVSAWKPYCGFRVFVPVVFVVCAEWLTRHRPCPLDLPPAGPLRCRAVRWLIYYALIFAVFYWGGEQSAFIYFQF